MKKSTWVIMVLLMASPTVFAQSNDNAELQKMYDEDQSSRTTSRINWKVLSVQDSLRERRVYQLINEGKVITAKDYYNTAMIFQHGRDSTASAMAVKQMRKAIELDPSINRWLLAAAIDRDLMRRGKPQIYGTQYVKKDEHDVWHRYLIDSTKVTDEERKYYGVETLAQQKVKERSLNQLSISSFHEKSKSVDKTVEFIQSEFKKGSKSQYNVSESAVNVFGYELMSAGKIEEALKIFQLNTELYPAGFNTFDSYGECLMKLNRTKEGLKAYRKSLDLNPQNENARKILKEHKQ